MKKILAIALAAVMVLGLASSALAVSWAAPATSTTASPFAVEVVKLGVNTDITGGAYYTVLDDAAAYDYSTIYYAIKLSLPSAKDANAYYGNSGFVSGNEVKVVITWTNVAGKSSQTVMVPLTSEAQTLWFDGDKFTTTWQQKLAASCGCGESHILSAVANGTKEVSVKACVGAEGKLSDVTIGGCYTVEEKKFYGVVPCVNCKPMDLSGWLFKGDCTAYDVFFATNSAAKVTGAYAVDDGHKDLYYGGIKNAYKDTLYGWRITGTVNVGCASDKCDPIAAFSRVELPGYAVLDNSNALSDGYAANIKWMVNDGLDTVSSTALATAFTDWAVRTGKDMSDPLYDAANLYDTFVKENSSFVKAKANKYTTATETDFYAKNDHSDDGLTSSTKTEVTISSTLSGGSVLGTDSVSLWDPKTLLNGYQYEEAYYVYGDTYTFEKAKSDARLFQQTSATTINCDTNEAAYLNTLNHLYSLLGFTYADIAAGNVYMNKDILLANFGFSTSICDTATWGAYTAAITVAPVTEVPATGVASFAGFAMIAVAAAAAAVAKKRD